MPLAVVRSVGSARSLRSPTELEDFEQELVDQYSLAGSAAGMTDSSVANDRSTVVEFIRFLGQPVWMAEPGDADRYLLWLRRERGLAKSTIKGKSWVLGRFFDFLIARYQGDIHAMFDRVLVQPIDEFNKPANVARPQYLQLKVAVV